MFKPTGIYFGCRNGVRFNLFLHVANNHNCQFGCWRENYGCFLGDISRQSEIQASEPRREDVPWLGVETSSRPAAQMKWKEGEGCPLAFEKLLSAQADVTPVTPPRCGHQSPASAFQGRNHTRDFSGSSRAFCLGLVLHLWSFLFWSFQLLGLSIRWIF